MESGNYSYDNSTMPLLTSEEEMYAMSSSYKSDDEPMSTELLEDIHDGSQSHPSVNMRESRYKRYNSTKQSQAELKGAILSTRNMGKGLQKLFKAAVNYILQVLPIFGEFGSEVNYFIQESINFSEVTKLSEDIKKPRIKATLKGIRNLINNQIVLVQDPEKGKPITPCMDVYKSNIQSIGSLDKLKLRIVVRGDM